MNAEKTQKEIPSRPIQTEPGRGRVYMEDNRPESMGQTKFINTIQSKEKNPPTILQQYKERGIQQYAEDKELMQEKFESSPTSEQQFVQREEKPINTGLPDNLKSGIENLSGYSMDDVKVHYNSDKPAQLNNKSIEKETDVMGGEAQHTVTQFTTNTTRKDEGGKPCIQLLEMQDYALNTDFLDKKNRREIYFSKNNIKFCNDHKMAFNREPPYKNIDTINGLLKGKRKDNDIEETQEIQFLENPLVQSIPLSDVKKAEHNTLLKETVKSYDKVKSHPKYVRNPNEDAYITTQKFPLKYDEVMFVKDDDHIYVAPNGKENIKLSHPSLLGGYPYEVEDAGTLRIKNHKITAINDSGHYGKGDGGENDKMTKMLNPSEEEQLIPSKEEHHSSSSSKCCYITTSAVNYMGLDDDCEELTLLRKFRDSYLIDQPNGENLIKLYYQYAPQIVEGIDKRDNKAEIYINLYGIVKQCAIAIKNGDNEFAFNTYCSMVRKLYDEFIDETGGYPDLLS